MLCQKHTDWKEVYAHHMTAGGGPAPVNGFIGDAALKVKNMLGTILMVIEENHPLNFLQRGQHPINVQYINLKPSHPTRLKKVIHNVRAY